MHVDNPTHICHLMLYHFEKVWKVAHSHFTIATNFFDEGTINKCRCMEWFANFKSGDTLAWKISIEEDDQLLLVVVEGDERLTTSMLAANFNVDHSTIVRHLKNLRKVWKLAGCFPHELRVTTVERVQIFTDLLQINERSPFRRILSFGDES
ncbi:HTH_48 domain-containing protein [Trichonephila inaurata madagascariensis]|uniref:HTH_48 domain-containing protein n=1 Tax=Trichonephila inaurata madagascariensis TaxID=2747483 RepID=A0A8X7C0F9_9ARAC|nr:HTH_48 domain-containing protein [Trichonephila inaurata madagascariensis]